MCAEAAHEIIDGRRYPPTRPPRAPVVFDPPQEEIGAKIDWSLWYLTDEDDMGQHPQQSDDIDQIKPSVKVLARERGWTDVRIASDEFFAWIVSEPLVRISPDVFLLDNPPPKPYPGVWETWKPGINPPRFALEIVSENWKKDYQDNPPKYAQLGTSELVIFDPKAARDETSVPRRVALQVFRREADGFFVRVHAGDGIARSEELDAWLVVRHEETGVCLRLARDPAGQDLVPTHEEALEEAERQRLEEQRLRCEAEQRRVESERLCHEAEERLALEKERLIQRLDQRFGPLDSEQIRQLRELDTEALLDGLLTAGSIDELLLAHDSDGGCAG